MIKTMRLPCFWLLCMFSLSTRADLSAFYRSTSGDYEDYPDYGSPPHNHMGEGLAPPGSLLPQQHHQNEIAGQSHGTPSADGSGSNLIPGSSVSGKQLKNKGEIDFSECEVEEDTGLCCIYREEKMTEFSKDPFLECVHNKVEQCHYTYITQFHPTQEEICDENFQKHCYITFDKQAFNETIRKCYNPLVRVCDDDESTGRTGANDIQPSEEERSTRRQGRRGQGRRGKRDVSGGQTKCKTFFESMCTTHYKEKEPGKFVASTSCEKIPVELCGKENCRMEPGPKECHDKATAGLAEVPMESCDLNPIKTCKFATKMVPRLTPVQECTLVPKEVCQLKFSSPVEEEKSFLSKWCLDPNSKNETSGKYPSDTGAQNGLSGMTQKDVSTGLPAVIHAMNDLRPVGGQTTGAGNGGRTPDAVDDDAQNGNDDTTALGVSSENMIGDYEYDTDDIPVDQRAEYGGGSSPNQPAAELYGAPNTDAGATSQQQPSEPVGDSYLQPAVGGRQNGNDANYVPLHRGQSNAGEEAYVSDVSKFTGNSPAVMAKKQQHRPVKKNGKYAEMQGMHPPSQSYLGPSNGNNPRGNGDDGTHVGDMTEFQIMSPPSNGYLSPAQVTTDNPQNVLEPSTDNKGQNQGSQGGSKTSDPNSYRPPPTGYIPGPTGQEGAPSTGYLAAQDSAAVPTGPSAGEATAPSGSTGQGTGPSGADYGPTGFSSGASGPDYPYPAHDTYLPSLPEYPGLSGDGSYYETGSSGSSPDSYLPPEQQDYDVTGTGHHLSEMFDTNGLSYYASSAPVMPEDGDENILKEYNQNKDQILLDSSSPLRGEEEHIAGYGMARPDYEPEGTAKMKMPSKYMNPPQAMYVGKEIRDVSKYLGKSGKLTEEEKNFKIRAEKIAKNVRLHEKAMMKMFKSKKNMWMHNGVPIKFV